MTDFPPSDEARTSSSDVTRLLGAWQRGDDSAFDRLMPLVYQELRRLAHSHMRRERAGHTLSTTALVHEAYINLVDADADLNSRGHFFGVASRIMRRVLVDYARHRQAEKRGGGRRPEPLVEGLHGTDVDIETVLAVDDALGRLEQMDERLCRVVECRYFAGLTIPETADALEVSPATVKRDWVAARAWLRVQFGATGGASR